VAPSSLISHGVYGGVGAWLTAKTQRWTPEEVLRTLDWEPGGLESVDDVGVR
jgi:hypothetical protein